MATCTYGIQAVSTEKEAEECKCLWTTSPCYSNPTSTLLVPLSFIKFKKVKHENSNFAYIFLLSFFATCNLKTVWCIYAVIIQCTCTYQTTAFLQGMCLFWFGEAHKLLLVSYSFKTVSKDASHPCLSTSGVFFKYSGCGTYSQATPRLINVCVTCCNKLLATSFE